MRKSIIVLTLGSLALVASGAQAKNDKVKSAKSSKDDNGQIVGVAGPGVLGLVALGLVGAGLATRRRAEEPKDRD